MVWVFDQPVSNSGRLKQMVLELGTNFGLNWEAILAFNPDKYLALVHTPVISSDAWILDQCSAWFNLIDYLITSNQLEGNFIATF